MNKKEKEAKSVIEQTNSYIEKYEFEDIKLTGVSQIPEADQIVRNLYKKNKELENLKKGITQPLELAKKNTIKLFKPIQQKIDHAINHLKTEILRCEKEKLLTVKNEYGVVTIQPTTSLQIREKLVWQVENLENVPDEFIIRTIDKKKIDALFKERKNQLNIPGIITNIETTLAVVQYDK